jgi:hypothetical protein
MRTIPAMILATVGSLLSMALAWGEVPAAVVEDVKGTSAGVQFMDYVSTGKVIRLEPRDVIVLGYLKSCWRETIIGGTVTVGAEQSEVQGGQVERSRVKCSGGRMQLTAEQAVQSAGVISRSWGASTQPATPEPQMILYGRVPIIELGGGGELLIERIDGLAERYEIAVGSRELVRRSFFDLAKSRRILAAGGLYRATFGAKQIIFKVDPTATATAPVVARLLRF